MKKVCEIMFIIILTIVVLSSDAAGKNMDNELLLNSSLSLQIDTTKLIHMIKIDSFRLKILPPSSGVQFYKDEIVFLSMSKYENKMSANQISFGTYEAYYAPIEDSVAGRHTIFSALSSFSYPCEAMTFSKDFNTIYFTKISEKDKKEKIFMAKFTPKSNGQTGLVPEVIPLDFCTDNFNYSHPTLSSDESMLIFASDGEASIGGMDLFISRRTGEKWSVPENLGKDINTAGNEFFPFLDSENNLYFSSDRLPGYGGYDIFTCKFNGSGWGKPRNLSGQINSGQDDIAFTINKMDGKTAFFTRRLPSAREEMQLFRVVIKQEVADRNSLTLSYVFNGKPIEKTSSITATTDTKVKQTEEEPAKTKPVAEIVKKKEVKTPEIKTSAKKLPEKKTITTHEPVTITKENKPSVTAINKPTPLEQKDAVIYRVQLLPDASQKKSKEVVMNGTSYKLSQYLYLGAIRYTIGEFSTLAQATALQRICRQSGNPQAFVAAFINNTRSLDPKLFK